MVELNTDNHKVKREWEGEKWREKELKKRERGGRKEKGVRGGERIPLTPPYIQKNEFFMLYDCFLNVIN